MATRILPPKAMADQLHIAIAAVLKMEFVVTWNLAHMANAHVKRQLANKLHDFGYNAPDVVTPEQLGAPS